MELVKEKMETLKKEQAAAGNKKDHHYVPPKKENIQSRYMEKDKKKKIDVENPVGRPLEFAFELRKGLLGAATM